MGLKADNAQIGQSGTATQNFNIRAPLDGTLRLSRGNAGAETSDPIKVEANNDITLAGNLLSGVLGAGQTYQDLTASRVAGTTYTNTTGKPIAVSVYQTGGGSNGTIALTVGGVQISVGGNGSTQLTYQTAYGIVPNGATYVVNVTGQSITKWTELR